jgi:pyroglutamyl-peptidase
MPRILVTAFEPYDQWPENSSWLTLIELTRWLDITSTVVTRRYPVDFQAASDRLRKDLLDRYDYTIHLGQIPGGPVIKLESTGLNIRTDGEPLVDGAPAAYRTSLPLREIRDELLAAAIPAEVSHYAGTYLCNALLYLSQHFAAQLHLPTRSMFIHLPLAPQQVALAGKSLPSCDIQMMSRAVATAIRRLEAVPLVT